MDSQHGEGFWSASAGSCIWGKHRCTGAKFALPPASTPYHDTSSLFDKGLTFLLDIYTYYRIETSVSFAKPVMSAMNNNSTAFDDMDFDRANYSLQKPLDVLRLQQKTAAIMQRVRDNDFDGLGGHQGLDKFCAFISSDKIWHVLAMAVPEFRSPHETSSEK